MGCIWRCVCRRRNRHLVICLFFLVCSLAQSRFVVEGRASSMLFKPKDQSMKKREDEEVINAVFRRNLIGSRPPRCEKRCTTCTHCEPIQVPVVPQLHHQMTSTTRIRATYFRGDDISNYKPVSWKCKCGDSIFDP